MKFSPHPKPVSDKALFKSPLKKKMTKTGEKPVFFRIWSSRPHKSWISGEPIQDPTATNFIHIIAKGASKYPKFKLYEKNIILGSTDEHYLWDNGLRSELKKLPMWNKMFILEEELKIEYKELHG